ncbi:MAG TPA: hypothetical protein VE753_04835 [Gaiellaceae bacterium]|nr:hypothetical protein [Gaiellaceae bacterium]
MRRAAAIVVSALAAATLAGCGGSSGPPRFDAGHFHGARIDNPWLPLRPGTTFVYSGTKDGKHARDVVTVSAETKEILGVTCVVVRDRLALAGEPAEQTADWYAQDDDGNVWYFGEATRELQNGKVTTTEGSWEAGVHGARPGVVMEAKPRVGDAYEQEHFPGHAEDHAKVLSLAAALRVPQGSYRGAQLTKEWTPLEPGVIDHKYYARGVGLVKEDTVKGPRESLVLVRIS